MRNVSLSIADHEIERIIEALRAIEHTSAWDRVLRIGEIVFEGLAGGNERAWFSRSREKSVSLRRIASSPDCPFQRSSLSSAVSVYLFVKTKPEIVSLSGIKPTHVAQVVTLDSKRATALLDATSRNAWSVRDLSAQVRALRKELGERRGRPVASVEHKSLTLLRKALRMLRGAHRLLTSSDIPDSDRSLGNVHGALAELELELGTLRSLQALTRQTSRHSVRVLRALSEQSYGGAAG